MAKNQGGAATALKPEAPEQPEEISLDQKLDMVLKELSEVRREAAALREWVTRMVRVVKATSR